MENYLPENILLISISLLLLITLKVSTCKFLCKTINMILEYIIILFSLMIYIILTYTFLHTVKLIHLCFSASLKL